MQSNITEGSSHSHRSFILKEKCNIIQLSTCVDCGITFLCPHEYLYKPLSKLFICCSRFKCAPLGSCKTLMSQVCQLLKLEKCLTNYGYYSETWFYISKLFFKKWLKFKLNPSSFHPKLKLACRKFTRSSH